MPILGSQGSTKGPSTAPTIGTATAGNANASVTFTAPSFSKLPITSYTITSNPGGFTGTGSSSPITVSGLTNGTAYTFTVTATHANGVSSASSASNSITPIAPKFGYYAGGIRPKGGTPYSSTITKFSMEAETSSNLSATLTATTYGLNGSGMANSGTAGYFGGGIDASAGTAVSRIDKVTFVNDSKSTLAAALLNTKAYMTGLANSGTAGFFYGGKQGSTFIYDRDRVIFSNDSRSSATDYLSTPAFHSGFANSGTAGYLAGGNDNNNSYWSVSTIFKITFSSDARSTLGATLTQKTFSATGFANSGTAGYSAGGGDNNGSYLAVLDKITFSNDSKSTLASTLSVARTSLSSFANSGTAGYIFGGGSAAASSVSTIDKLTFSNDSRTTLGTGLIRELTELGAFANSGTL